MKTKFVKVAAIALALGLIGGCGVTQEQLDEVRVIAENARTQAHSAQSRADSAHQVASEAAYAASEAQRSSQSALECCNANTSRLDRMFEKAMTK